MRRKKVNVPRAICTRCGGLCRTAQVLGHNAPDDTPLFWIADLVEMSDRDRRYARYEYGRWRPLAMKTLSATCWWCVRHEQDYSYTEFRISYDETEVMLATLIYLDQCSSPE